MTLSRQSKNVSLLTGSTGLSRMLLTAYKVRQKMISDSKVVGKHPFSGKVRNEHGYGEKCLFHRGDKYGV